MATTVMDKLARASRLSDEMARLAERVRASVVAVRGRRSGGGSGVVWNDRGLVITNYHVAPGDRAEVVAGSGARLAARAVAHSESLDLAALQVEGELTSGELTPAAIGDSAALRAGELVMAVGNPLGEKNAVTLGVVSGVGVASWFAKPREVVQVAITLRPGNSGGALADAQGRVVGIPHMVINPGLALAVPSHVVERFLIEGQRKRGWFGIGGEYVELPLPLVETLGLASPTGILLMGVATDSPAEQAGMTIGDIVVDVSIPGSNGRAADLFARLGSIPAGQPALLTVVRAAELRRFEVVPR